jgi:hypothetical protein
MSDDLVETSALKVLREAMVAADVFGVYHDQTDMAEMPVSVIAHLHTLGWRVAPEADDEDDPGFKAGYEAGQRGMAANLAVELRKYR